DERIVAIANQMRDVVGNPCMEVALADVDPNTAGLQVDCKWTERVHPDPAGEVAPALTRCTPDGAGAHDKTPCWYLTADDKTCATAPEHLKLAYDLGAGAVPPDTRLKIECR